MPAAPPSATAPTCANGNDGVGTGNLLDLGISRQQHANTNSMNARTRRE